MSPPNSSRRQVRQYVATKQGGPFQIIKVDYPTPGPDEICIRNRAVALNPLDVKSLDHGMMVKSWPEVFGIDAAGVVEAVGENVTDFKAGDAVMSLAGFGGQAGAFQDVTVVPSHFAAKKPTSWTFEEAASVPLIYLTASAAVLKGLAIRLPFMQDPPKDLLGAPDGIAHVDHYNRNHSISVTKSLLTSMLSNKESEEENYDDHPSNLASRGPLVPPHGQISSRNPQMPRLTTNLSSSGNNSLTNPFAPQGAVQTGGNGGVSFPAPRLSSVLVLGGSSGVGSSTIQLLRIALGPEVTLLSTNSPANDPHCLKVGADTCIDRSYDIDELVAAVKKATPGKQGVDAIVDAVGALSPSGPSPSPSPPPPPLGAISGNKNAGPAGNNSNGNGDSADKKAQNGEVNQEAFKIFSALNQSGPKLFSQVMTSPHSASLGQQIPPEAGVKVAQPVFGRMTFEVVPGGMRAMSRLTELVDGNASGEGVGRFKLPLDVEVVGKGLESIGSGLDKLRGGVSGTKLVVSL